MSAPIFFLSTAKPFNCIFFICCKIFNAISSKLHLPLSVQNPYFTTLRQQLDSEILILVPIPPELPILHGGICGVRKAIFIVLILSNYPPF
jgi:hypothetical protein